MIENPRYNRAGGHNVATSGILNVIIYITVIYIIFFYFEYIK